MDKTMESPAAPKAPSVKKYQCIRDCFAYGRKWDKGEVLESDKELNHHFVLLAVDSMLDIPLREPEPPKAQFQSNEVRDPMRPITSSGADAVTLSEIQQQQSKFKMNTGMAAPAEK